jgi:hypothetical protein
MMPLKMSISRIRRLSRWYESQKEVGRPSEHEIVAYMITPLLLGMGCSEQLVAVEWNKIDMAFFNRTPLTKKEGFDNCIMILEAKKPNQSLTDAYTQANNYVDITSSNSVPQKGQISFISEFSSSYSL